MKLENGDNIKTIEKLKKKLTEMEELAIVREDCGYCKKCGHEAEDGYQLDAHHLTKYNDGDDPNLFNCQHCDESFSTLTDLMAHKNKKAFGEC